MQQWASVKVSVVQSEGKQAETRWTLDMNDLKGRFHERRRSVSRTISSESSKEEKEKEKE